MNGPGLRLLAPARRRADHLTASHAAAGHQCAAHLRPVVAAGVALILGVRPNSPQTTTSDLVEQAPVVQVLDQRRQPQIEQRQRAAGLGGTGPCASPSCSRPCSMRPKGQRLKASVTQRAPRLRSPAGPAGTGRASVFPSRSVGIVAIQAIAAAESARLPGSDRAPRPGGATSASRTPAAETHRCRPWDRPDRPCRRNRRSRPAGRGGRPAGAGSTPLSMMFRRSTACTSNAAWAAPR